MTDDTQVITKKQPTVAESYLLSHNLSGRFWIALILAFGLVITTILVMSGFVKLDSNAAIAVYTSFAACSGSIVSIYMGQNQKPKEQEASTSTTTVSVGEIKK